MTNKKLIFILGSPRSGTTLLLSYLCGLKTTKILYETRCLINPLGFSPTNLIEYLANLFDSVQEEIVIEKTPEHVHYLDIIEQLRKVCKRDIHVIYVLRPPVPTILSLVKAAKINPEIWGEMDVLGACEKYEESLVSIYHNFVGKRDTYKSVPYSLQVTYQDITVNTYSTLYSLLVTGLHLDLSKSDIENLITNRIENTLKVLPTIKEEKCHVNILRSAKEVQKLRRKVVDKDVKEYGKEIKYIRNYFEHPKTKESLYDLASKKQLVDTQKNPLVTIVVPIYNKEDYIKQTLDSLINQTYQNIRVLVIDDASTDKSLEIAEEYYETLTDEQKGKLWIIRGAHNKGVSFTRNIGLLAFADIYSFCDADDVWDIVLVEKSVATFKKYPYIDCVYSRVLLLSEDETVTKNHSKICNGYIFDDALEYNFLTCGSNLFIRASIINEYNIRFNPKYDGCEDWDFLLQLAQVATFKCTKEYLVKYRQLPNSLSTNKELQVSNGKKILDKYVIETKRFKRIFTRLFLYYFSVKNLKLEHIKDLDFRFILRVVVSKLKSFVKSYLP